MTDFWEVVFTPSFLPRIGHVFAASWAAGAAFVASVGAHYVLKKPPHADLGKAALSIALPFVLLYTAGVYYVFRGKVVVEPDSY